MAFLKDVIKKPITGEWGAEGNTVSVLRTTNFTNSGVLDLSNVIKRDISDKKISQKKLIKGDVIIEKSGGSPNQPVGRVVFFEEDGLYLCNNFTSVLRPRKDIVEPKYLHYLLFAGHKFGVTEMFQNKTTGIINLQLTRYIAKINIPLPPLETQKHIVEILDNAAALRDKTKQLLEAYDQLAQSIFLEMFGDPVTNPKKWEKKKLSNFGNWKSGETPSRKISEYFSGDIPWVSSGELNDIYISDTSEHITSKALKESSTHLIEEGSILLGMYDTAALKSSINKVPLTCNQAIAFCKLEGVNTLFVYYLIQIAKPFYKRQQRGICQKNLNLSMIKNLEIINPDLKFQDEFAEKIVLIEQQKELAQKGT